MWYEILYVGRSHILPFRSCMTSSRFEAYISAKFPSDGNRGTSRLLNALLGGKVKVIKHDSYFGLGIRGHSWLRDLYLGFGICLGLWTRHASLWV